MIHVKLYYTNFNFWELKDLTIHETLKIADIN